MVALNGGKSAASTAATSTATVAIHVSDGLHVLVTDAMWHWYGYKESQENTCMVSAAITRLMRRRLTAPVIVWSYPPHSGW